MSTLDMLFDAISESPRLHAPGTAFNKLCKAIARASVVPVFSSDSPEPQDFGPFGRLSLPYTKMGAIDSLDLFGLDELIIFAFYHANRRRYRKVLDIGANLGLHSIIMSRCGFEVRAFEPDPWHFGILSRNLMANDAASVRPDQAAVSTADGTAQFVRVLGNTTGSHLAGAKDSYGEKEVFTVPTRAVGSLFDWADLAKIDAEGHEKDLLLALSKSQLEHLDIMVEIGNAENAKAVFAFFDKMQVGLFAQKVGWARVNKLSDVPTSHREGSLFITTKAEMPWRSL